MALVLARNIGETVWLTGDITVTVLGINGSQVKLGFIAPEKIKIYREEIYQRILKEQEREGVWNDESTRRSGNIFG